MENLVNTLLVIVAIQSIAIVGLVVIIKELRDSKKQNKKTTRGVIKGLVREYSLERQDKNRLQEDYNDLYNAYQEVFVKLTELSKRHKEFKKQYDALMDSHLVVCGNLADLVRDGRVIKSKFMGKVFTYKIEEMTKEEITNFFGEEMVG